LLPWQMHAPPWPSSRKVASLCCAAFKPRARPPPLAPIWTRPSPKKRRRSRVSRPWPCCRPLPTCIEASLLDASAGPSAVQADGVPTVRVAEAEKTAAERRIDAERIRARPDVAASVGVTRSGIENEAALTIGLGVALPLFDRNRGNIDAAHAELRAAEARVAQARQEARADRAAAVARLAASDSRVSAADAGVTSSEEAYRLSRIGAETGRISQLELRVTRAALINARAAAVDARLARVRAEIDLARLDGRAPFQGAQ